MLSNWSILYVDSVLATTSINQSSYWYPAFKCIPSCSVSNCLSMQFWLAWRSSLAVREVMSDSEVNLLSEDPDPIAFCLERVLRLSLRQLNSWWFRHISFSTKGSQHHPSSRSSSFSVLWAGWSGRHWCHRECASSQASVSQPLCWACPWSQENHKISYNSHCSATAQESQYVSSSLSYSTGNSSFTPSWWLCSLWLTPSVLLMIASRL